MLGKPRKRRGLETFPLRPLLPVGERTSATDTCDGTTSPLHGACPAMTLTHVETRAGQTLVHWPCVGLVHTLALGHGVPSAK